MSKPSNQIETSEYQATVASILRGLRQLSKNIESLQSYMGDQELEVSQRFARQGAVLGGMLTEKAFNDDQDLDEGRE